MQPRNATGPALPKKGQMVRHGRAGRYLASVSTFHEPCSLLLASALTKARWHPLSASYSTRCLAATRIKTAGSCLLGWPHLSEPSSRPGTTNGQLPTASRQGLETGGRASLAATCQVALGGRGRRYPTVQYNTHTPSDEPGQILTVVAVVRNPVCFFLGGEGGFCCRRAQVAHEMMRLCISSASSALTISIQSLVFPALPPVPIGRRLL